MSARPPLDDAADLALEALVDALVEALIRAKPQDVWEPVQRWRPAESGDAEACMGPASIWDVAMLASAPQVQGDLFGEPELAPEPERAPQAPPQHRTVDKVRRLKGRTVVAGLAYPCGRWTDERAEAERIRRAKQIVPKRAKAAESWTFKLAGSIAYDD